MHHIYGASEMWLDELCSAIPLRIPHPKIDMLVCQAQGAGILAKGEITIRDAYCTYLILKKMQQCASISYLNILPQTFIIVNTKLKIKTPLFRRAVKKAVFFYLGTTILSFLNPLSPYFFMIVS